MKKDSTKNKQKVIETVKEVIDKVSNETLESVLGDRYAAYAKDVIQDRAIPDVRDGLKPVQRRIIYTMFRSKSFNKKPRVKCAKTVGDVMGNYHPHGDSSIYEALVRMGQDWVMNVPLIDFQGNNGSIDGDGAAAYRYTESRLEAICEELTLDLDKHTVDMQYTYDDSKLEPIVLPARFPNLLVNGSSGIGVGFATQIPPHNFHEVIEATIHRIQYPNCRLEKLREFIKGPDFPTGGTIHQSPGLDSVYVNGQGRIDISSNYEIVQNKKEHQIIISEIPYGVKKQEMVFEIDKIVHAKTIDGMLEIRDESHGTNIRIVIDLKPEAKSDLIVNYLIKNKLILGGFSANMVAIVEGRPKTLGLIEMLDAYINHQQDVLKRRTAYDLRKNEARLHLVEGLIKAILNIDEVVKIIRASKSKQESKENLMKRFSLSDKQTEAILMMPLYRLNNTDVLEFEQEQKQLKEEIAQLSEILKDPQILNKVLINELRELNKKYKVPRRTIILEEELEVKAVDERELIAKEEIMLAVTRDGYIKRSSLKSYASSGENALPGLKSDDVLIYASIAKTTDFILAFTSLGNYLHLPVHQILEGPWKQEGKHINYLVTMSPDEKIISVINVSVFRDDLFIGLVSSKGQIKRTRLSEFSVQRYTKPITCMRLMNGDSLADAHLLHGNDDLILIASNGKATFFNENEIAPTGIRSAGIKGFASLKEASVVGFYPYQEQERTKMMILTNNGSYKIFEPHQLEITKRLGKTQDAYKIFKSDPHQIIYLQKLDLKNKEKVLFHILTQGKNIFEFTLEDFYLTPVDKYAKCNIPNFDKKDPFVACYKLDQEFVGKSTKSEASKELLVLPTAPSAEEKPKKESTYEELSIFDLFGD